MKLKTKSSSSEFSYTLCPEGTHAAVCVAVVDLGTQPPSGKFADQKPQRKTYLVWELTEEATRPLIAKDYTASLNEKANLRRDIEKWRGRKFGEDEEFDINTLAGKKCLLTITHTGGGDRKYHNVAGVAAPMKGMQIRDAQVQPFTFDLDDGEPFRGPAWDLPFWYGRSIEEVIAGCEELRAAERKRADANMADEAGEVFGDEPDEEPGF